MFHCQGQIHWWLWDQCSSDCSSCCHIWAMAARWSWRRTGSRGTRQWWHCSRSQHTGLWGSPCSQHLRNTELLVSRKNKLMVSPLFKTLTPLLLSIHTRFRVDNTHSFILCCYRFQNVNCFQMIGINKCCIPISHLKKQVIMTLLFMTDTE